MKINLIITVLFMSSFYGFSQAQPPVGVTAPDLVQPRRVAEDALAHNYLLHFQMIKEGTNRVDFNVVTARRSFQISLDKPPVNFSGRLLRETDDQAYLEYEFMVASPPEEPEKKGGKSQANNQMFASGLVSFVVKSALNYNPQQNETNNTDPRTQHPTSLRSSVWLRLGRPITIMGNGRDVYKISVDRLKESGQ